MSTMLSTAQRSAPQWLLRSDVAPLAEPLMLEVQRRLHPVVTWQRILNRYQDIITLRFNKERLVLSCNVHGEDVWTPKATLYITLSTDEGYFSHESLVSWLLGQSNFSPRFSNYGKLSVYRYQGERGRSVDLRHDDLGLPSWVTSENWHYPQVRLADDIITMTQGYIDGAA